MQITREVVDQVFWVGGNDNRLERFENMFALPEGVAYNSYLIVDEQTVLLDTVDRAISGQYLENIRGVLQNRTLDYLVINHMEPDHCANIEAIVALYPEVTVIGNKKTFDFFHQYYQSDLSKNSLIVKEGDTLSVGKHTLKFYMAPMVHWPEVMFTFEESQGILFSADAFGSFGLLRGNLFADEVDWPTLFLDETRRYYANIVGRYGSQVQAVFKRLPLDQIKMIFPLHGPLWRQDLPLILNLYNQWSTYTPEKKGVTLVYASMYGNTESAVFALANKLAQRGVKDLRIWDVSKSEPSFIISDLFKYSHFVLASPTYNMHLYLPFEALLRELTLLNWQNRRGVLIGNHTWSSAALKVMQGLLGQMKDIEVLGEPLDILSSLKAEREGELDALATILSEDVL
ncbi:MAG: FprA family A-type flavoprotein [Sphaerochaetaceae bacterium]